MQLIPLLLALALGGPSLSLHTGRAASPLLGAVSFNAAADALKKVGPPTTVSSYSACGWVKFDSSTNDDSFIFMVDATGTGLALEWKTGVVNLVDTHGFARPANVGGAAVNGTWYFVGIRVNGTTATIFRGDAATSIVFSSGTIPAQGPAPTVWFSFTSNVLTGSLALWRLWDAQLSNAELEAERLTGSPARIANLTAFWPFSSVATKLVDTSGNSNTLVANSTGPWEDIPGPGIPR